MYPLCLRPHCTRHYTKKLPQPWRMYVTLSRLYIFKNIFKGFFEKKKPVYGLWLLYACCTLVFSDPYMIIPMYYIDAHKMIIYTYMRVATL